MCTFQNFYNNRINSPHQEIGNVKFQVFPLCVERNMRRVTDGILPNQGHLWVNLYERRNIVSSYPLRPQEGKDSVKIYKG